VTEKRKTYVDFLPHARKRLAAGLHIAAVVLLVVIGVTAWLTLTREIRKANAYFQASHQAHALTRYTLMFQHAIEPFTRLGNWMPLMALQTTNWADEFQRLERATQPLVPKNDSSRFRDIRRNLRKLHDARLYALRLLSEGTSLPLEQLPKEVAEVTLSKEEQELSAPLKVRRAIELLESPTVEQALLSVRNDTWNLSETLHLYGIQLANRIENQLLGIFLGLGLLVLILIGSLRVDLWLRRGEIALSQAFVELGEKLSSVGSTHEACRLIVEAADRFIGWDSASVALWDPQTSSFQTVLAFDEIEGKRTPITLDRQYPANSISRRVLAGESLLFLRGTKREPPDDLRPFGDESQVSKSLRYVPIRLGERTIGLITIQSYRPRAYSDRDLRLLEWLADRFAAALERAQLVEALRTSEEHYRVLSERNLDGVYIHDGEHFLYANHSLAHMLGYDNVADLTDHVHVIDVIHPADRPAWLERMKQRLGGQSDSSSIRLRILRKDGETIYCDSMGTVVELQGRKVIMGTLREVTAQVRTEEELRRLHDIYRQAILSANAVPYRLDFRTKRYDFPAGEIERLTGYSSEELTWENFGTHVIAKEVFYPRVELPDSENGDGEQLRKRLEETRRNKILRGEVGRYQAEYLFRCKDGRLIWLADSAVTERDQTGEIIASIGILQDITERKRLEQRAQVFAELGNKLTTVTSAAEAAELIAGAAAQLFEWHSCNIRMLDSLTGKMSALVCYDTIGGVLQRINPESSFPSAPTPLETQAMEGKAILIVDRETDERAALLTSFGDPNARSQSVMIVGIRSGDQALGTLSFQSYRKHAFTPRDLEDLQALAGYCAAGLERVQSYERLQISESQLRTIWEQAAVAMRLTDSQGLVWMVNPAYCELTGKTEEELIGKPFTVVYDSEHWEEMEAKYRERFATQTVEPVLQRKVRLWNGRELWVEIANRFVKTQQGVMLISFIADRTKELTLQHELERKNQELETLATTDALTGLANRRLALTLFERELGRARRYRLLLSVLMLDIDHFKQINDTYGHLVGDEVLRRLGEVVRTNIRAVDVAGRYGGEEFLIVMPETGLEGALVFAERLRSRVADLEFDAGPGKTFRITISVGVTQCEDADAATIDDLLAAADRALYQAKREGRNRVAVA